MAGSGFGGKYVRTTFSFRHETRASLHRKASPNGVSSGSSPLLDGRAGAKKRPFCFRHVILIMSASFAVNLLQITFSTHSESIGQLSTDPTTGEYCIHFLEIAHSSHQLILVEILARDGVGCLFSSFLRANSKRIHFSSKEAKKIFSITLVWQKVG